MPTVMTPFQFEMLMRRSTMLEAVAKNELALSASDPPYPLVTIDWLDAYTQDEWLDVEDFTREPWEHMVHSTGWLIYENDLQVILAHTISPIDPADGGGWKAGTVTFIPKGVIVHRRGVVA
jgi:hypothetical protein